MTVQDKIDQCTDSLRKSGKYTEQQIVEIKILFNEVAIAVYKEAADIIKKNSINQ